jgi:ubiquinone/menaquinone biosynthesis C-methylase UbiE
MKTDQSNIESGFTQVTEKPGDPAHHEQLSAIVTRYTLAAEYARGGDVLELACGAGVGLGLLAQAARSVTAGDIDPGNLRFAQESYREAGNIRLQTLDACQLSFPEASFDVVIIFEAIYYLPDLEAFFAGVRRVLRPGGKLLISSVNREWHGFNPSMRSVRYYSLSELRELVTQHGFACECFAAFEDAPSSLLRRISHPLRRMAAALHLIPKTMKGKALLKRIFYGKLAPLPRAITAAHAPCVSLKPVRPGEQVGHFKYVYVVAAMN